MSKKLYLIAEHETDLIVFRYILTKRFPSIQVVIFPPPSGKGGISWLAKDIKRMIDTAIKQRSNPQDCIIVLHDADELTRPTGRNDYDKIKLVCDQHAYAKVVLLIARDELQAWILADNGFCQWVGRKAKNFDGLMKPSDTVATWLNDAKKPKWSETNLDRILKNVEATGDKFSPSMRNGLEKLSKEGCLPASPPEPQLDTPPVSD